MIVFEILDNLLVFFLLTLKLKKQKKKLEFIIFDYCILCFPYVRVRVCVYVCVSVLDILVRII